MSHPVFLNNAPYDRMPNGSANEWSTFFSEDCQELQANAFFPLLWMALFSVEDLRWARLVDDDDIGSSVREEAEVDDVRYPYLVTSQQKALGHFAQRKPRLKAELGPKYAGVVDAFEELIRSKYSPYILLRTSGLPDPEMQEPGLLAALTEMEEFGRGKPAAGFVDLSFRDVRTQPGRSALIVLTGAGDEAVWLSEAIAGRSGEPRERRDRTSGGTQNKPTATSSSYKSNPVAEWGAAIVLGLATVGVYLRTHSALLAIFAFLAVTAIAAFVLLKFSKRPAPLE
ncbi:MAG: hypothetical protein HOQ35_10815 [Acidobacteriaceae bacterium]|nr:hypothetical protein [Acidobacteriaceae bacterium]